ncbi:MAG: ATP-dependent serine protease, partial [Bacteroidales bacterium]
MELKTKVKPFTRAKSVSDILRYKPKALAFDGEWLASFGTPELSGCWLIWGGSGNGKTRFVLQLCKYLC